jgi:hypothetical protein
MSVTTAENFSPVFRAERVGVGVVGADVNTGGGVPVCRGFAMELYTSAKTMRQAITPTKTVVMRKIA